VSKVQDQSGKAQTADPFTAFWTDFMSKMGMPGGTTTAAASVQEPEFLKQMRQTFFQAMARSCDDFMRSDQFLAMMKQSMDNALAFRQQLDRFLTNAVHSGQQPAREDTDHILLVLRSMEERVLGRLEELNERVSALEGTVDKRVGNKKPASGIDRRVGRTKRRK